MRLILGALLILFLSQVITESLTNRQLKFLNRLIPIIDRKRSLKTVALLQNSKDKNCTLQYWIPGSIPILRLNEQTQISLRRNFNQNALALVCMDNDSDFRLLNHLAMTFETMRQERIILWMQRQPREEFFQQLSKKIEELKFMQMVIMQMGEYLPIIYRMNLHPNSHFVRIRNIFRIQGNIFLPKSLNFMGRTAIVDANIPQLRSLILLELEDREVFEFARHYNLSLKMRFGDQTDAASFDIQLTSQFLSKKTMPELLAHMTPASSSLIVIVPCGRERSLKEVFKQLDVRAWLFYIFCMYALLVLVETFILVVTYRISGRTYRPTRINPLVNLRVFGAIIGMSFPVRRRETLSLRQLFLSMSIFGMVFSNFFSCKLSALLTKQSHHPQVTNFEELRASGMTVVVDRQHRSFIESELHADFFHRILPMTMIVPKRQQVILLLSMNGSYGYIILQENWPHINEYQRSKGQKVFCTSPGLGIINNIPMTSVLPKDSLYKWPLSTAVRRLQEAGISQHWRQSKYRDARRAMNLEIPSIFKPKHVPLSLDHLKLLWYLLLLGYGTAFVIFLMEVFLYQVKRSQYRRNESIL